MEKLFKKFVSNLKPNCLTVVFTFLVLWPILVHIFSPRKDKACYSVFVFVRGISNGICDLALYLLHKGLNISFIYDAIILF